MKPQELTITFDLNSLNLTQLAALANCTNDRHAIRAIQRAMDANAGAIESDKEFNRVFEFINETNVFVKSF
jgi:dsRNA-specific ribonuclease